MGIHLVIIALLLSGCATVFDSPPEQDSTIPLGEITTPYWNWYVYCAEHPEREECK